MNRNVYHTTIEKIERLSPSVKSFYLRLNEEKSLEYKPGQFISVHIPKDGIMIRKPYSIASPPFDKTLLELCIKKVEGGYVSTSLFKAEEGMKLTIDGPDGVFTLRDPFNYDLIFIGAGTGVAPLRSMIQWLFDQGYSKRALLFFGGRAEIDILYRDEFYALQETHPNFKFIPTLSRSLLWEGEKGYVQEVVGKYVDAPGGKMAYVCGLAPMINAVKEKLKSIGFDRKQIFYEKYV